MNRFEQRLRQRLQNPEFAAGYREMGAEIELLQAIEAVREQLQISKEELATRLASSQHDWDAGIKFCQNTVA